MTDTAGIGLLASHHQMRATLCRVRRTQVTLKEWCAKHDIVLGTAVQWRHRYDDFPKPVETIGRTHLYSVRDLDRWWTKVLKEGRVPPARSRS